MNTGMTPRNRTKRARYDGPPRTVLYIRCSTNEQAESGLGLVAQENALRSECERRGWVVAAVLSDAGASGKSLSGRPALAEALRMIDAGEAACLMVSKLDRLSRSLLDFAGLMARAQRDGWNVVALDLGIDLSTPAGEFMASVMASAAQWERRIIGQRTKDALAVKRAEGVRLGRPACVDVATVKRMIQAREAGETLKVSADGLDRDGVPTAQGGACWYPATVRAVLRSQQAIQL